MSLLPALFEIPRNALDWQRFSWNNKACVQEIQQAIQAQKGINLTAYSLDPIPFEAFSQWLAWNQQSHTDINGVLGLQGVDLESVNIQDERQLEAWIYLNYQELYAARATLKI